MGWCNFSINIDEIEVIQGLQNKKRTYGANNIIKSGIGRNILTYHGKIFLQPNNALSDTYTEVVSRRQFKWDINDSSYHFYSTDKAIITASHRTLEYFEVIDDKEIIRFFENLKSNGRYNEYFDAVHLLFKNIDDQRILVESGYGKIEDSVDFNEYIKGVSHDAQSRKLKL